MNKLTKDLYPAIIERYRNGGTCHGIAKEMDLCRVSVTGVIKRHGMKIRGWTRLQDTQHAEISAFYVAGKTIAEIAEMYQVSWNVIRRILRKTYTSIRDQERFTYRYSFNIEYFDRMDSPEKAYWLGFLWADGHNADTNKMYLTLQLKDKDHLVKFREAMRSNHKVYDKISTCMRKEHPSVSIQFHNKHFCTRLRELGMFHNKTERVSMPDIPDHLFFHFVRGFIDGDGSICLNPKKGPQISFSSHSSFVDELSGLIANRLGIHFSVNHKPNYSVAFISGNKQVAAFLRALYADSNPSIRMDRKYEKYLEVMTYCQERARDKTNKNLEIHK